jgi:hypothetical protein
MIRNIVKRLPKKSVVGLAVLGIALVAGGGAAKHAEAAGEGHTIEVSFETLKFSAIDDGLFDSTAEASGELRVINHNTSEEGIKLFGTAFAKISCSASWIGGAGQCNKKVDENTTYFFSQTGICTATRGLACAGPYFTGNNKVFLHNVKANDQITFHANMFDYDAGSANDNLCNKSASLRFTDLELRNMNRTFQMNQGGANDDGVCTVRFNLRRI